MKKELLHKYLSGTCTEGEKQLVQSWINESPENRQMMREIEQIWEVSPGKGIDVNSYQAWDSFRERNLDKHSGPVLNLDSARRSSALHKGKSRRGIYQQSIAYSVAAAAVLFIAFLFYSNTNTAPIEDPNPELVRQEITTEKGQRTTVRLSDGTRIHLNAESKLSVPENYMDKSRVVYLEGEAFFDVVSNEDRPFTVNTSKSVTRVLGTKFNVTAYPDEEKVHVVVAEGKVTLGLDEESQAQEVELTREQRGTITKNGEIVASNVIDIGMYLDWSRGRLTFRDAPLEEVEKRLERWYDIEIIVDNRISSKERLLTGTFQDVSISSVLNSIAISLELSYTKDGRKITFEAR